MAAATRRMIRMLLDAVAAAVWRHPRKREVPSCYFAMPARAYLAPMLQSGNGCCHRASIWNIVMPQWVAKSSILPVPHDRSC